MNGTGNLRLDMILDNYARRRIAKLSSKEILNELKAKGITSLEDLVEATAADFGKGGAVAKTTFIYEQFIYKESRVLPDELIDAVENQVNQIR